MFKRRESGWQKRLGLIVVAVALSFATALIMRSFDAPGVTDSLDDLVMPTGQSGSEETVQMFITASEQMQRGDYQAAVATYEAYMDKIGDIPIEQRSSYFGDLGMAHLYEGHARGADGDQAKAREHYVRAAVMFEQAALLATHSVLAGVANYYQLISFYYADDFARTRDVGELFLRQQPEAAVAAELLPESTEAIVKEILSVSYFHLAQSEADNPARAKTLRENGIRYAEEAIDEAPERVIQPYYYTGIAAWERGDTSLAEERLQHFLDVMGQIPRSIWDHDDMTSVDEAKQILQRLRGELP